MRKYVEDNNLESAAINLGNLLGLHSPSIAARRVAEKLKVRSIDKDDKFFKCEGTGDYRVAQRQFSIADIAKETGYSLDLIKQQIARYGELKTTRGTFSALTSSPFEFAEEKQ
jgi:hypothetical protein